MLCTDRNSASSLRGIVRCKLGKSRSMRSEMPGCSALDREHRVRRLQEFAKLSSGSMEIGLRSTHRIIHHPRNLRVIKSFHVVEHKYGSVNRGEAHYGPLEAEAIRNTKQMIVNE